MLNGTLITNAFLQSAATELTYERLINAARRLNINMDVRDNGEFLTRPDGKGLITPEDFKTDFVLFWNKDVPLGAALEGMGIRLFNPSRAIALCDNKADTFEAISKSGYASKIRLPKTIRLPMTFAGIQYSNFRFLDRIIQEMGFPFIIKECYGSYGGQVYLAHDRQEAENILGRMDGQDVVAQEYIASSSGRDIRAYVVGGEVAAAIERRNDNDFRANIAGGGSAKSVTLTSEQRQMALDAAKALNLDFAGVDLLYGSDGGPVLCEVNSNAQFKGLYEATGVDAAEKIMEYISQELNHL